MPANALNKLIGDIWKALSAEGRKPYDHLAAADKRRYLTELSSYNEVASVKIPSRINPPPGFNFPDLHPMPMRTLTAYSIFAQQVMCTLQLKQSTIYKTNCSYRSASLSITTRNLFHQTSLQTWDTTLECAGRWCALRSDSCTNSCSKFTKRRLLFVMRKPFRCLFLFFWFPSCWSKRKYEQQTEARKDIAEFLLRFPNLIETSDFFLL